MSESLPNAHNYLHDIVNAMAIDHGGQYIETHPRFNVGINGGLDVILIEPATGERDRLLLTQESPDDRAIYDCLTSAGVPQLDRLIKENSVIMYRLPFQAKPLSRERLFVDKTSSSTYISDSEIFINVGMLWSRVHLATGRLPSKDILSATIVLDFKDNDNAYVPAPPYFAWVSINKQSAEQYMEASISSELQQMNPSVSHKRLMDAVKTGWNYDREH